MVAEMNEPLSIQQNVHRMGVRMDCVFEGTAYNPERETVREMRLAGKECGEISIQTGMPPEHLTLTLPSAARSISSACRRSRRIAESI